MQKCAFKTHLYAIKFVKQKYAIPISTTQQ